MKLRAPVAALVVALASPAIAAPPRAEEPATLRLGTLKSAEYAAASYMKEHCRKFGLEVEEVVYPKAADLYPAIARGDVDIAASTADAAIASRAAGMPLFVVAGVAKGGFRIVGRPDLSFTSLRDLKGKKVGVARGGTAELLLLATLAKAGLSASDKPGAADVTVAYMAAPELVPALLGKQIDAMCHSEPEATQVVQAKTGVEIAKPYDTAIGEPVRVLVMTERLYTDAPELAQKVVDCLVDATETFAVDADAAERYVRVNMFRGRISPQEYREALANAAFSPDVSVEHVQATTDLMARHGVGRLQKTPVAKDWVKLDLLQRSKAQAEVKARLRRKR